MDGENEVKKQMADGADVVRSAIKLPGEAMLPPGGNRDAVLPRAAALKIIGDAEKELGAKIPREPGE